MGCSNDAPAPAAPDASATSKSREPSLEPECELFREFPILSRVPDGMDLTYQFVAGLVSLRIGLGGVATPSSEERWLAFTVEASGLDNPGAPTTVQTGDGPFDGVVTERDGMGVVEDRAHVVRSAYWADSHEVLLSAEGFDVPAPEFDGLVRLVVMVDRDRFIKFQRQQGRRDVLCD